MLLLAAPVPVPPSTTPAELAIYGLLVLTAFKMFVEAAQWGAKRIVGREDADKQRLETKVDQLSKDFTALEMKISSYSSFEGQLKSLDNRVAEQGKALRQELKEGLQEVTVELNRKLTQTLNSELHHVVREELNRSKRGE